MCSKSHSMTGSRELCLCQYLRPRQRLRAPEDPNIQPTPSPISLCCMINPTPPSKANAPTFEAHLAARSGNGANMSKAQTQPCAPRLVGVCRTPSPAMPAPVVRSGLLKRLHLVAFECNVEAQTLTAICEQHRPRIRALFTTVIANF